MSDSKPKLENQNTDWESAPDSIAIPPWEDIGNYVCAEFAVTTLEHLTDSMVQQMFQDLRNCKYAGYKELYTDGSKMVIPNESVSAALVVMEEDNTLMQNWKLQGDMIIMEAELYAILKALEYIETTMPGPSVIYSGSQSGLGLILNSKPSSARGMIMVIQDKLAQINKLDPAMIQFIPGHRNIHGNELADMCAKAAHANDITPALSGIHLGDQKVREINKVTTQYWEENWIANMGTTGKGLFIYDIKSKPELWPWAFNKNRKLETSMARLRVGHAGLNCHLKRFNLKSEDSCDCGEVETISHYFLHCPLHRTQRNRLKDSLAQLDVDFNVKNILGGGQYGENTQMYIVEIVGEFLVGTRKLKQI